MNIPSSNPTPRNQGGMATLVFIILLAIMTILITAETRSVYVLHRDVKILEQQQLKRLNGSPTNPPATSMTK